MKQVSIFHLALLLCAASALPGDAGTDVVTDGEDYGEENLALSIEAMGDSMVDGVENQTDDVDAIDEVVVEESIEIDEEDNPGVEEETKSTCKIRKTYFYGRYRNISRLGVASFSNNPKAVNRSIDSQGCDPNYNGALMWWDMNHNEEDDEGEFVEDFSVLHIIATQGSEEALEALIDVPGLEINPLTSTNTTPVYEAAFWGQSDIIKSLAKKGGDVTIANFQGTTPLHITIYWGYYYTAVTLVSLGADMNARGGFYNRSPVAEAAYWGYKDIVQFLISQGADVNIVDDDGWTALKWAKYFNYDDIAQILEDNGGTE